jgi:hypothetical protein
MPTFCPFVKPGAFNTDGLAAKVGVVEDEDSPVGEVESVDAMAPVLIDCVDTVRDVVEAVFCEEVDADVDDSTGVLSDTLELAPCD